jgi:hypothetical protein
MKTEAKKEAVRAYKERKPVMGAFAVRCAASGEVWVGQSKTVDTYGNRLWFSLRLGTSPSASLKAAWQRHGEGAFSYEVLALLTEEEMALTPDKKLAELRDLWADDLRAERI